MISPTSEAWCAEGVFLRSPLFVQLTLKIICQGQAEHETTFETS